MEDPVGRRFVLPLTRFEKIAHDGDRSGMTQALRHVNGVREGEHTVATAHEDFDQRGAQESAGSRDERRRPCNTWHAGSVQRGRSGDHPQPSHGTRTALVQPQR
jgi:hypothetical protein